MQDIDFDEIDRAVSSVTNSSGGLESNTTPTQDTSDASAVPTVTSPTEREASTSNASSPAARRSTGRFMDVVHPSSDMRPSPTPARPAAPSAPTFHREEVAERTEVASRPEPATTSSAAFHWPDPIDIAQPHPEPVTDTPNGSIATGVEGSLEPTFEAAPEPTPDPVVEPTPVPATDSVVADLLDDDEEEPAAPLESPFLADAKVEKRPLGAFSGADADLPLIEDPIPPFGVSSAVQSSEMTQQDTAPAVEAPDTDIPRELHDDVLLLEAHGEEEPEVPAVPATPAQESLDTQVQTEAAVSPEVPAGPTSISQQYKEQPSTDTQPSGSIFDTEAYHQALTHPAKKRSSALIIVWIIALILVGGGIGVAIYFFVLPMLG